MNDAFFAGFNVDLHDAERWRTFYKTQAAKDSGMAPDAPPVPRLDGRWLFNDMMRVSTAPDPWTYPALQRLKASGRFILAAMSNTVIFPNGHPLYREDFYADPIRSLFDVFVVSHSRRRFIHIPAHMKASRPLVPTPHRTSYSIIANSERCSRQLM